MVVQKWIQIPILWDCEWNAFQLKKLEFKSIHVSVVEGIVRCTQNA